jgi:hypothetical protein
MAHVSNLRINELRNSALQELAAVRPEPVFPIVLSRELVERSKEGQIAHPVGSFMVRQAHHERKGNVSHYYEPL